MKANTVGAVVLLGAVGAGAYYYFVVMPKNKSVGGSDTAVGGAGGLNEATKTPALDTSGNNVPVDTSPNADIAPASQAPASTAVAQKSTTNAQIKSVLDPGNLLPAIF